MGNWGRYLLDNTSFVLPLTILCALSSFLLLPGLFFASIIIAFITLTRGYRKGAVLLISVLLPFIVLLIKQHASLLDILFFVGRYSLVWGMAALHARYASWRLALELLMVLGILIVISTHFFVHDINQLWYEFINQHAGHIYQDIFVKTVTVEQFTHQLSYYANMGTGLACIFVFVGCSVQVLIAEYWQSQICNEEKSSKVMVTLRMGPIFTIIFTLVLLGKCLGSVIAMDCWPLVIFPFAFSGLSLLHTFYHCHKQTKFKWLMVGVYAGLLIAPGWIFCLLATISYIDSGLNLCKHYQLIGSSA